MIFRPEGHLRSAESVLQDLTKATRKDLHDNWSPCVGFLLKTESRSQAPDGSTLAVGLLGPNGLRLKIESHLTAGLLFDERFGATKMAGDLTVVGEKVNQLRGGRICLTVGPCLRLLPMAG